MRAIILAAGRGSRMKDLTDVRPKCLVELRGKPLLDWQLETLRGAGISEIGIVTGYKREMLADRGLVEFYNSRWDETQMVSSLACAEDWLQEGPCIVSYSDIFYGQAAVRSLIECTSDLAVTFDPNWLEVWTKRFGNPLLDAETFRMSENNILIEIGNKPQTIDVVQGQYMGLLRFTPAGWNELVEVRENAKADVRDKMHMTGALMKIIENGKVAIKAISYSGNWGEVDSQEDLAVYQQQ